MSHFPVLVLLGDLVPPDASPDDITDAVTALLDPYCEAPEAAPAAAPAVCPVCAGPAAPPPEALLDYWSVGGRWEALLASHLPPKVLAQQPAPVAVHAHWLRVTVVDAVTALVTPDGQWHARAAVGWFGKSNVTSPLAPKAFAAHQRALFRQHRDGIAVLVDAHI